MPCLATRDSDEQEQMLPVARTKGNTRKSVAGKAPRRPLALGPEPGREQSEERDNQTAVRSDGAATR
ncbi:hypothetical protein FRC08_011328 [Ceratobasidium sp. 394]|nr:hypothetical protein FRC08_011328 [Ceratobasidium sp. 394]KAG9092156.1 hypothetical protein FS749_015956 [Ceratobasidium sp. UAMH 11750]